MTPDPAGLGPRALPYVHLVAWDLVPPLLTGRRAANLSAAPWPTALDCYHYKQPWVQLQHTVQIFLTTALRKWQRSAYFHAKVRVQLCLWFSRLQNSFIFISWGFWGASDDIHGFTVKPLYSNALGLFWTWATPKPQCCMRFCNPVTISSSLKSGNTSGGSHRKRNAGVHKEEEMDVWHLILSRRWSSLQWCSCSANSTCVLTKSPSRQTSFGWVHLGVFWP